MTHSLADHPLTDEDVASSGAIPWAELPEPARERFRAWLATSDAGPTIAATVDGDMDYALWLAGSKLRCGVSLDDDHRAEYEAYRAEFDDPRSPRNLFTTLAAAVTAFDNADGRRTEEAGRLRDAAGRLLDTTVATGELWWRKAVLRRLPAEPDTGDASDMYVLSVFDLTVSVHIHQLPDVTADAAVGLAGDDGHGPVAHVLIETQDRTDPRVLVSVDGDHEQLHNAG